MTIQVSFATPNTTFTNYPNICEEVKRMAIEMGIKRNIRLENSSSPSIKTIYAPSDFATLNLPKNFSPISSPENPKDHWLRHELVHILHNDDLQANKYSKYTYLFTLILGIGAGCVAEKILNYSPSPISNFPVLIGLISKCAPLFAYYSFLYIKGGKEALKFNETRADEEACKYLSLEEKINAIKWLYKLDPEGHGDYSLLALEPDAHLSSKERIKKIWNSFLPQQKLQHSECNPENLFNQKKPKSVFDTVLSYIF
jgi:hypothetical protein